MITELSDVEWEQHKETLKQLKVRLKALLRDVEDEIEWMGG